MKRACLLLLVGLVWPGGDLLADPVPAAAVTYRIPRLPDILEPLEPGAVRLDGYLGARVANNARARLLAVDEEPLLAGFRQRPGRQAWIGEHVGKWLHAATLAWAYTGDPALRAKLDRVAAELLKTQEPDGYLGTYVPGAAVRPLPRGGLGRLGPQVRPDRAADLLPVHRQRRRRWTACRKIGDLLIRTFGPGKKSILAAGTHVGMAATSVLEPMVLLYRITGDPRYLEFAQVHRAGLGRAERARRS